MSNKEEIISILDQYPQYRETLFRRGYLITTSNDLSLDTYPFYGHWNKAMFGELKDGRDVHVYYHELQDYQCVEENGVAISMIGHAYNPFNMKYKEEEILKDLFQAYKNGEETFFDKVSELTGIHLIVVNDHGKLLAVQDCGGMKSCYYGVVDDRVYITSHPQLVGDICNLEVDPFVKKLTAKWFFSIGGRYLPGNLSPYRELKRLGPNTYMRYSSDFTVKRFFPIKEYIELEEDQFDNVISRIAELINNNIKLCSIKWNTPAISLSGGMDSKTTLACANGLYDRYKFYSFHCKPQEVEDANAASELCKIIGVPHDTYAIPDRNEDLEDFEVFKKIIIHNSSNIGTPPDHEIRKFIYLYRLNNFDVELKSWISEVGRAMWGKKYGVEMPNVLTPRHFSIFQTRYIGSPGLLKKSDQEYRKYLKEINLDKPPYNYEHQDFFYWEFRFGSWGASVVTTHDIFSHTVTMPINNRILIDICLWFPHAFRTNDMVNKSVIELANKKISDSNISVHNVYLGGKRVFIEKLYYHYMTLLYKG